MLAILFFAAALDLATVSPQIPEIRSLIGISSLAVEVEGLKGDALADGLTADQLKTDVEQKLRLAGIRVDSKASDRYVTVRVAYMILRTTDGKPLGYCFNAIISFKQMATLVRNRQQMLVSTWERGSIWNGPVGHGKDHVQEVLRDLSDQFISIYLAANPKP